MNFSYDSKNETDLWVSFDHISFFTLVFLYENSASSSSLQKSFTILSYSVSLLRFFERSRFSIYPSCRLFSTVRISNCTFTLSNPILVHIIKNASFCISKYSTALHLAIVPVSLIFCLISPIESAFSWLFTVYVLSFIRCTIFEDLSALSMFSTC